MQVRYVRAYLSSKRSYQGNKSLLKKIDKTEKLFIEDCKNINLQFKHIDCSIDKKRYSIRVLNTQYRILMTVENNIAELRCVCDHDTYDRKNKNC